MTYSEIQFNYSQAIKQASTLESIAKGLDKRANNDLSGILNNVNSAWKSDSAPAYISKGNKVKTDILTTAKNLRAIASSIRTIAKNVRDAELEALRIAQERSSAAAGGGGGGTSW